MISAQRHASPIIDASDVLASLLVAAKRKTEARGRFFFNCYEPELQETILELQNQFPGSFLAIFVYGEKPLPWSPTLTEALTHLTASGWIGRPYLGEPHLLELKSSAEAGFDTMIAPFIVNRDTLEKVAAIFMKRIRFVMR